MDIYERTMCYVLGGLIFLGSLPLIYMVGFCGSWNPQQAERNEVRMMTEMRGRIGRFLGQTQGIEKRAETNAPQERAAITNCPSN